MPNTMKKNSLMPTLAMLLVAVTWGASFSVTKTVLNYYEPGFVILCRMCLGALVFLLCWRTLRRTRIARKDLPVLCLMILFEPILFFLLESYALTYTSASQAGMIVATSPLFTAVAAWIFLREKPGVLMWIGFVVAIFGIVLLSFDAVRSEHAPNPVLGNILEALCLCCGAGFIVCVKKLGARYSPFFLAAAQAVGGAIFFVFFAIGTGVSGPASFETVPVLCLLYLGVLITFGGISIFNYGLANLPAATSAGLLNLVPLFAVLFGALALGEELNSMQWAAGGFVIAGVLISQRAKVKMPGSGKLPSPDKLKKLVAETTKDQRNYAK